MIARQIAEALEAAHEQGIIHRDLKPANVRTLGRQNLFALAFGANAMKTPAGRAKKIAALVAMLERGETIFPERTRADGKGRLRR